MSTDSKLASSPVTKEIESRIKQIPEHLFEVFLEIREPNDKDAAEILMKYPPDFSDDILKTATNFAYPCKIPPDEQSEHFAFVVLDSTGTLFRFGYCRRSNREATCLCIISFYPWFEAFYSILNDLAQIINSKSTEDMEKFLSSLYNYKLMSNNEKTEKIEIKSLVKSYFYTRPDTRELPSTLTNRNFAVMFSRLGPEIMLNLFANLLFERRIIFVSSKLFHLTACAYGCLHLIYPMHWQSIFLPILPASMTWTTQCTAPYIIGLHSSVFATLNMNELGDVVIVNIDERKLDTQYDDLSRFPKYLTRSMKKGIQNSSQSSGDQLARVFLRAMAFAIGNYASGFVIRNEKLDFDRDLYLEQYLGSHNHTFMSSIAQTQMFEQFSRYRTYVQLQRETDIDEFDLEVKTYQHLQQSKKYKTNKKIYKLLEKYIKDGTIMRHDISARKDATISKKRRSLFDTKDEGIKAANPLLEQVQNKAGKFQIAINKAGQRVASEASSVRNNLSSFEITDVIKRTHNSRPNDLNITNPLSKSVPLHQSNSVNALSENAIPYERFSFNDTHFPSEPRLINGDRDDSFSSDSSRSSTPEPERPNMTQLISIDNDDDNPLLPSPIILNVINSPFATPTVRPTPQVDSKIKQLQSELQYKVQTFDGKRIDPRDDCGSQTEIKKLVKQFDPLDEPEQIERNSDDLFSSLPVAFRSTNTKSLSSTTTDRHPSIMEAIPANRVTAILQNIQSNYGTTSRFVLRPNYSTPEQPQQNNNLIHFSPPSTTTTSLGLLPRKYSTIPDDTSLSFDPLAPTNEKSLFPDLSSKPAETNGSNLIDF